MTITFLQPDGVPITAQAARQGMAALYGGGSGRPLGGRSGLRPGTAVDTLTATSTVWTLKPCSAMIDPGASVHQGMYGWATDATITGTVAPADATYPRVDAVYVQINDSSAGDGSAAKSAPVTYLAGTPSATPVVPDIPARSFLIGTLTVPPAGAGSPVGALNLARFTAAGGIHPVTLTDRDALDKYDGLTVRRIDLRAKPLQTWSADDSKWFTTNGHGTPYVPSWAGAANFGIGGSLTGTYWVDGDRVTVRAKVRFGTEASLGTGAISCPLPDGLPIGGTEPGTLGTGFHVTAAGILRPLVVFAGSSTTATVWTPQIPVQTPGQAAYPTANGDSMEISISYQTSGI